MKIGIYQEDGWAAKVEILEDTSNDEWERYKLQVIETYSEPAFIGSPPDHTIFEVKQKKGVYYGGMWRLTDIHETQ